MNAIFALLPDSAYAASEPLAIFLWGIALVLLSFRLANKPAASHEEPGASPKPSDSPLIAKVS